jgi:hypothetical protein
MALHPDDMNAAIISNLPTKTGHPLSYWIEIVKAAGPFAKVSQAAAWLKKTHAIGHISATVIAREALGVGRESQEQLLSSLFRSPEDQALLDRLSSALKAARNSTIMTACKTYVGFGDPVQYAVAKPSKVGGLIVGLDRSDPNLPALDPAKGLGGSARIAWKLHIKSPDDIDRVVQHVTFVS